MLEPLFSGIGVLLLLAGCTLATIGLIGMILKPDLFEQLHVAGLLTGPGVILVLLASVGTGRVDIITSAVLVTGFVLVTSSISTHVIAQAGVQRYVPTTTGSGAATAGGAGTGSGTAGPLEVPGADGAGASHRLLASGMRVVVAYDGSAAAGVAADLVAAIDWPAGTVVRFVGATHGQVRPLDPNRAVSPEPDAAGLEAVARRIERPGLHVETAMLSGDAADAIIDETASFGADLLVTGSRRRSRVSTLLGWSATGEIVDRSPCPVLVARSTALRSAILTTDGSAQSVAATEIVARWPIFDLTRIHVVAVSTDAPPNGRRRSAVSSGAAEHQRNIDVAATRLLDAGREVMTELLHGRPGAQVVEAAERRKVDLIVIGSRGRTGLGRTILGSVAGEVLASASGSVLIVGPPVRRPDGGS